MVCSVSQRPVASLDHSIALRVVWGGSRPTDVPSAAQFDKQFLLELGTLIRMDLLGQAEVTEDSFFKGGGYRSGCGIRQAEGVLPAGEVVS